MKDSMAKQFAGCTTASNIRWPDALNRHIRFDSQRATWGIRVAVNRDDRGPTLGASSDVVLYPDGATVIDRRFGSCGLLWRGVIHRGARKASSLSVALISEAKVRVTSFSGHMLEGWSDGWTRVL